MFQFCDSSLGKNHTQVWWPGVHILLAVFCWEAIAALELFTVLLGFAAKLCSVLHILPVFTLGSSGFCRFIPLLSHPGWILPPYTKCSTIIQTRIKEQCIILVVLGKKKQIVFQVCFPLLPGPSFLQPMSHLDFYGSTWNLLPIQDSVHT